MHRFSKDYKIIIFDEVQLQPLARQAIKHLVKDGRYDYIETGSLLSIKKNVQNILIPSEETRMTLYPLDFDEFRWATGDNVSPDFMQVDEKKREIIMLYDDDFRKIDATGKASQIFMDIPAQLSSNANRYIVSSATESRPTETTAVVIKDMEDSMVVTLAYHANDPNVGLGLTKDYTRYKMFLNDTGLFITLAFWDKDYTENTVYNKLLSDKLSANLGYVYENLVAQMLVTAGNSLYYYTFPDGNNHNYEVDFLLSRGNKIVPIEVKSSGYKTHKSLDEFCKKYLSRIGERILLYTKDYQKDDVVTCLPVYYAGHL